MKKATKLLTTLAVLMLPVFTIAQDKGSGNVTAAERSLDAFDAVKVGCAINLMVSQGPQQIVKVETDDNLQDRITTKVNNGLLEVGCSKMNSPTKMNVYVTAPSYKAITSDGAATVKGLTPLTGDKLKLTASGAAKMNLEANFTQVSTDVSGAASANLLLNTTIANTEVSGAGKLKIAGETDVHNVLVSGVASLKGVSFITNTTNVEASGAGSAAVTARKQLKADLSGAGSVTYLDNSVLKKITKPGEYVMTLTGMENIKKVEIEDESDISLPGIPEPPVPPVPPVSIDGQVQGDDVSVIVDGKKIVVITDDSVRVKLGTKSVEVGDDGKVKIRNEHKKPKFDGHWAGFELGVNGYVSPNFGTEYPEYLDLNYNKSINININFYEQNFNLYRNHFGLVTGLGLTWNNYRFDKDVIIAKVDNELGQILPDPLNKYEKSKLVNTYLTIPALLEFQTNAKSKTNSFHITGGVVGGLRIASHTKVVYTEPDGDRKKDKTPGNFYLNPFKLDVIAKIGWGKINLYGTYSLTQMFREGKAPELYPFSIGICLTDL